MKKKNIALLGYVGVLVVACIVVMVSFFVAYTMRG